ncbi:hypothetical protein ACFLXD_06585 [Chloroflexota bacterium]
MGKRDYRHRESKKSKKDTRKLPQVTILATPPVEVEVSRKKGKKLEEEE